jgi:hypothetical protein
MKASVARPCWSQGEIIYVQRMLENQKVNNTLEIKSMLGHKIIFPSTADLVSTQPDIQ